MQDDLTQAPSTGVRWQAQMEQHLTDVRALTAEAMRPGIDVDQAAFRAGLAQAHSTAALALAISNTGGDLELRVSEVAAALESINDTVGGMSR